MEKLLGVVILLPLLGAAFNGFLGKRFGDKAVSAVGIGSVAIPGVIAWILLAELIGMDPHGHRFLEVTLFEWIHVGTFEIDFALYLDPLSAVMLLIVTNIGALIHLYSVGYMKGDPSYWRFFGKRLHRSRCDRSSECTHRCRDEWCGNL
jgi:NADH-quinone oxidoreductase subunit L